MKLSWNDFKTLVNNKSLLIQCDDRESSYRLSALDGLFRYECSFLKSSPANSDQIDFETYYKSKVNQKIGLGESQPFSIPAYRTKLNAIDSIKTVPINTSLDIDFKLTEERYVTGGALIIENAEMGDYFTAEVMDLDGIIPAPYRPYICENYPSIAKYVEKSFVEIKGQYTTLKIDTYPLNAKISANLYLRLTYFAINAGVNRNIALNYNLTKKL